MGLFIYFVWGLWFWPLWPLCCEYDLLNILPFDLSRWWGCLFSPPGRPSRRCPLLRRATSWSNSSWPRTWTRFWARARRTWCCSSRTRSHKSSASTQTHSKTHSWLLFEHMELGGFLSTCLSGVESVFVRRCCCSLCRLGPDEPGGLHRLWRSVWKQAGQRLPEPGGETTSTSHVYVSIWDSQQ